jgi:hypothetical protein
VTHGLERRLGLIDQDLIDRIELDAADSHEVLARHIATLARRALQAVPGQDADRMAGQLRLADRIADAIAVEGSARQRSR